MSKKLTLLALVVVVAAGCSAQARQNFDRAMRAAAVGLAASGQAPGMVQPQPVPSSGTWYIADAGSLYRVVAQFPYASTAPLLFAADGTYLGKLSSDRYAEDSVSNQYGEYGSKYGVNSINNPYSPYHISRLFTAGQPYMVVP